MLPKIADPLTDPLADPDGSGITISGCGAWESPLLTNLSRHSFAHYSLEPLP